MCSNHNNWNIAQSNPCFEVWLYYHKEAGVPNFEGMEKSKPWKEFINEHVYPGGFDSRKDAIYIGEAIENSKKNFSKIDDGIEISSTEVYKLAESFYPFVKKTIENALKNNDAE